jgi:CubicO group peptidase (beta-lactamase class C family)
MANSAKHIRNTTDTQFNIASMGKMFTAVAVLQLVKQGKLALDEPIGKYWPDYPNHNLANQVTIRELLDHTGGTGDIFTSEFFAHRLQTRTLTDYVRLFGDRSVRFEPGTRMEYSNYGYILLGRLIELVTGETYDNYVQEHIFAPAGMSHTDLLHESAQGEVRAIGYMHSVAGLIPNTSLLPWAGTSAGGGYSTVDDLLRFARALRSGKLVSRPLVREATTDQTHYGYGLGFNLLGEGSFGHEGGMPGANGELLILPRDRYVLIVLVNRDPRMASGMGWFIRQSLPQPSM